MKKGIHDHVVPGEGDMDLGSIFKALHSTGFDGSLSLDLYKYEYVEVARKSLKVLRNYTDLYA
jgi:sugar phosphate isomerase/epimerase